MQAAPPFNTTNIQRALVATENGRTLLHGFDAAVMGALAADIATAVWKSLLPSVERAVRQNRIDQAALTFEMAEMIAHFHAKPQGGLKMLASFNSCGAPEAKSPH